MLLTQVLKEHKERRKKDSDAVMTMVIKQSKPSPITHQSRLGTEELFVAIDPDMKELLYYEDKLNTSKGTLTLDKTMLLGRSSYYLQNDKQDLNTPEMLEELTEVGGVGFIWSVGEKGLDEEWRHSVAPIPSNRLVAIRTTATDELEHNSVNYSDEDVFEKEVEATFLRAIYENVKEDQTILEVKLLRMSHVLVSSDCAGVLFYVMMKLAVDTPHSYPEELVKNVAGVIGRWQSLLKYYLPSVD